MDEIALTVHLPKPQLKGAPAYGLVCIIHFVFHHSSRAPESSSRDMVEYTNQPQLRVESQQYHTINQRKILTYQHNSTYEC